MSACWVVSRYVLQPCTKAKSLCKVCRYWMEDPLGKTPLCYLVNLRFIFKPSEHGFASFMGIWKKVAEMLRNPPEIAGICGMELDIWMRLGFCQILKNAAEISLILQSNEITITCEIYRNLWQHFFKLSDVFGFQWLYDYLLKSAHNIVFINSAKGVCFNIYKYHCYIFGTISEFCVWFIWHLL